MSSTTTEQEHVAVRMPAEEGKEAKLARLEKELLSAQSEVDTARDAYDTAFSQAQIAASVAREQHAVARPTNLSGPSAYSMMEKSKVAQRRLGTEEAKLAAKRKEFLDAGGVLQEGGPTYSPAHPAPPRVDASIEGRIYGALSGFRKWLGYEI